MSAGSGSDHLFVSYRSSEAEFALRLASELARKGAKIWMDRLEGIEAGDDWVSALQQALNHAAGLIPIISPDYVVSTYCRRELNRADQLDLPIYPVLLFPVDPRDWPLEIQEKQYLDFTEWRDDRIFARRLSELFELLVATSHDQIALPPDPQKQYLISLIAELESARGVLQYVDLDSDYRQPPIEDEWGFSHLTDRPDMDRAVPDREPALPIGQIAAQHPKVVVLGAPGSGKTTTLRRLALNTARRRLDAPRLAPLPIVRYLGRWASDISWPDFLSGGGWPFTNHPKEMLRSGDAVLFLDGLNELGAAHLRERITELKDWLRTDGAEARVVLSCRLSNYRDELVLDNVPIARIEPLEPAQIATFCDAYLGPLAPKFLSQIGGSDVAAAKEPSRSIDLLAANPYMLSALIYLFDHSDDELPRNAGQLFQKLTRALWERERQRNTAGWRATVELETILADVAYSMIKGRAPTYVPAADVADLISAEFADATASAQIAGITDSEFYFSHQLMLEYYAALKMASIGIENFLDRPRRSRRYQWKHESVWDHVHAAFVGLVDQSDLEIEKVAQNNPNILGIWAANIDRGSYPLYERLLDALLGCLESDEWDIRMGAAEALGNLGDPIAVPALTELLDDPYSYDDGGNYDWKTIYPVRATAIRALDEIADPRAVPALIGALNNAENHWLVSIIGRAKLNAAQRAIIALNRFGTTEANNAISSATLRAEIEGLRKLGYRITSA